MRYIAAIILTLAAATINAQPYAPVGLQWVTDTRTSNQFDGLERLIALDDGRSYVSGFRYRTPLPPGRVDGFVDGVTSRGENLSNGLPMYIPGLIGGDATTRQVALGPFDVFACGAQQVGPGSSEWHAYVAKKTQTGVIYAYFNSPGQYRDEAVDMVYVDGVIYAVVKSDVGNGESTVNVMKIAADTMAVLGTSQYTLYPAANPRRIFVVDQTISIVGDSKGIGGGKYAFLFRAGTDLVFLEKTDIFAGVGNDLVVNDAVISPTGLIGIVGGVYPTGNPNGGDGFIAAFDGNGDLWWSRRYDGIGGFGDRFKGISARYDLPHRVEEFYAFGSTSASANDRDFLVASYAVDGTPLWQSDFNVSLNDELNDGAIDRDGNPVGTGSSLDGTGDTQMSFLRLDQSNGNLLSSFFWGATVAGNDVGTQIATDGYGDIHIVGQGVRGTNGYHGLFWRMIHPPVAVNDNFTIPEALQTNLLPLTNDTGNRNATAEIQTAPSHGTATPDGDRIRYTPNPGYLGPDSFMYRIRRGPFTSTGQININVIRVITSFTLAKNQLAGASSTTGTVTMSSPAGPGGDVVTVTPSSPALQTPATVSVPNGSVSRAFPVTAQSVASPQIRFVTVTFNGRSISQSITILPLAVSAFQFTPNPVVGGNNVSCRAVLNGVAGPGAVMMMSDNSAFCTTPASVPIPAGSTQVIFNITTSAVPSQQLASISATIGTTSKVGLLKINP